MKCRKARQLLNNKSAVLKMDLIKHLKNCPSCSREAYASEILDSVLRHEKEAQLDPATPFGIMRAKVESLRDQRIMKENSIMSRVKSGFNHHPRLAAGLVLVLAVLLFVTLIPFSYTRTVGYTVAFGNINNVPAGPPEKLVKLLGAMGYNDINIMLTGTEFKIAGLPTREAAREAALAFQELSGIDSEPIINQVTEQASGSLYAQALEKKRTIDINAAGKTDAEIQSELTQKLAEAGYQADVSVTTNSNGERQIKLKMSKGAADSMEREEIILNCKDSAESAKVSIGMPMDLQVETEGKTDEQIIQEVRAKLAEQGINDAEINVVPGPDGKRRIEVKAQKEEQH